MEDKVLKRATGSCVDLLHSKLACHRGSAYRRESLDIIWILSVVMDFGLASELDLIFSK